MKRIKLTYRDEREARNIVHVEKANGTAASGVLLKVPALKDADRMTVASVWGNQICHARDGRECPQTCGFGVENGFCYIID